MTDRHAKEPSVEDVRAAARTLEGVAVETPLLNAPVLDGATGGRLLVKPETLQRTGSFKFRGAYNALASMDPEIRERGVLACSSGNHAQGVAAAAALFGVPATIVMPSDAPALKRDRTEEHGARIVSYDRATGDREAIAAKIARETGMAFVAPYDDPHVIAGQGTVGLELMAAASERDMVPDAVLVPCSGGGLTAGVALAVEAMSPGSEVWAVEPAGFDDYTRSLASGRRERNDSQAGSICDALVTVVPGEITFGINLPRLAGGLVVSDEEALAAVAFAWRELKLVVEPGGAVALAAVLSGKIDVRGRTVAVILSGGNIDPRIQAGAIGALN